MLLTAANAGIGDHCSDGRRAVLEGSSVVFGGVVSSRFRLYELAGDRRHPRAAKIPAGYAYVISNVGLSASPHFGFGSCPRAVIAAASTHSATRSRPISRCYFVSPLRNSPSKPSLYRTDGRAVRGAERGRRGAFARVTAFGGNSVQHRPTFRRSGYLHCANRECDRVLGAIQGRQYRRRRKWASDCPAHMAGKHLSGAEHDRLLCRQRNEHSTHPSPLGAPPASNSGRNSSARKWNGSTLLSTMPPTKRDAAIFDVHNYAGYRGSIGTENVPTSALGDLWRRIALRSRSDDGRVWAHMNKPQLAHGNLSGLTNIAVADQTDGRESDSSYLATTGHRHAVGSWATTESPTARRC